MILCQSYCGLIQLMQILVILSVTFFFNRDLLSLYSMYSSPYWVIGILYVKNIYTIFVAKRDVVETKAT